MSHHWVFGYGSLIWKADFPFLERRKAVIEGWERRFWQGSHDHRGTPESPGRVVTLIPVAGARCAGVAYRVAEEVFEHLDYREKNGYQRREVDIHLEVTGPIKGTVYFAAEDNPAFLGDAPLNQIADHIAQSSGPSGSNVEYLLELADALRRIETNDDHIFKLESLLKP